MTSPTVDSDKPIIGGLSGLSDYFKNNVSKRNSSSSPSSSNFFDTKTGSNPSLQILPHQPYSIETCIDNLIPAQKNAFLIKALESSPNYSEMMDDIIMNVVKTLPTSTVQKIQQDVENDKLIVKISSAVTSASPLVGGTANAKDNNSRKKSSTLNSKNQSGTDVNLDFESQLFKKELRKFWYEGINRDLLKNNPYFNLHDSLLTSPSSTPLIGSGKLETNVKKSNGTLPPTNGNSEEDVKRQRLKKLTSYVPKLVLRRLLNSESPIACAEMEPMVAAVFFADISGFTPLTEKLASLGLQGIEQLTLVLNTYFDRLISCIHLHGGDIIKFAGDALLVVWPIPLNGSLFGAVLLACQCAKALLKDLNNYSVENTGCTLRLHIGVGAGEIAGICVGGVGGRVEYFVSGTVLEQVSSCEKQALPGEVYVSALAWMLVPEGRVQGVQKGKGNFSNWRLDAVLEPMELPGDIELPVTLPMESALKQFIQPAVMRHLASGSGGWLGELRHVSVIFVSLTVPFREYRLVELQEAVASMQEIIFRLEGTLRQFMIDDKGSVLIAGWGVPPFSHEDDAVRAVQAAIEIHTTLNKIGIPTSIGVTTGKAFCGDVGSTARREYAMVGDIVNLSARLMVNAHSNILTDQDTFEACRTSKKLSFKRLDDIRVKGKVNPIAIYVPSRRKSTAREPTLRQVASTNTPNKYAGKSVHDSSKIVGRVEEMKAIAELVLSMKNKAIGVSSERTLVIEGPEGVGKSLLVRFFEQMVKENIIGNKTNEKSPIMFGAADQINNSTPYHAWQEIFQSHLLDENGKVPRYVLENLDVETLPLLNVVLPLGLQESATLKAMSAQKKMEMTLSLLVKLLKMIASPGMAIVLDNAHCLDSSSWSLTLAAIIQLEGVLFVLATRTTRLSVQYTQIVHRPDTMRIPLSNLNLDEVTKLMSNLLGVKKVPEKVITEIYRKGQGNPYITEQLADVILQEVGTLKTNKMGELILNSEIEAALQKVPEGTSALFVTKVDKLKPQEQTILKIASIIGIVFTEKMIEMLHKVEKQNDTGVREILLKIQDVGLIQEQSEAGTWAFANTLLREVVYGLMLFSLKRTYHIQIADYYMREQDGISQIYPIVAHHYKLADSLQEALEFYTKAGSSALQQFQNTEAVSFFNEAIVLAHKLNQTDNLEYITLTRKLATSFHNSGRFDKADEQYRKAMELMGVAIPQPGGKIKPLKKILSFNFCRPNFQVEDVSEVNLRKREAVIILLGLAKTNYFACNRDVAHFCSTTALEISGDVNTGQLSEALAMASLTYSSINEYKMADQLLQRAFESSTELDVKKNVMQVGGMIFTSRGNWERAEDYFIQSLEASKTVGDLRSYEETLIFLGTMYYLEGDLYKSIAHSTEALKSAISRGDIQSQMLACNSLARNYYAIGDLDKCQQYLSEASAVMESDYATELSSEMNFTAILALMFFSTGNNTECLRNADNALALLQKRDPACFFTFIAYAATVEVFIQVLTQYDSRYSLTKIPKSKLVSRAEKALHMLGKFSNAFPFAVPRLEMWKAALIHLEAGKANSKSEKEWTKAMEAAKNLKMRYDEAFIMYEKGRIQGKPLEVKKATEAMPFISSRNKELNDFEMSRLTLSRSIKGGKVLTPNRDLGPRKGSVGAALTLGRPGNRSSIEPYLKSPVQTEEEVTPVVSPMAPLSPETIPSRESSGPISADGPVKRGTSFRILDLNGKRNSGNSQSVQDEEFLETPISEYSVFQE